MTINNDKLNPILFSGGFTWENVVICCSIIKAPKNKYGILAVDSSENIYWKDKRFRR